MALLSLTAALLLAGAANATDSCRVVVLRPAHAPLVVWLGGMQAVVAELSTSGCEVIVRAAGAKDVRGLLSELSHVTSSSGALGAVSVVQEGSSGVAYVWTGRGVEVAKASAGGGAVAEGAVALRVLQLLRVRSLSVPTPAGEVLQAPPASVADSTVEARATGVEWVAWTGAGASMGSEPSSRALVLLLGARLRLWDRFGIDATIGTSALPAEVDTAAGRVELGFWQATLHAMVAVVDRRPFELSVGLGGGSVWARQSARARPGFRATEDATFVTLLAARAVASLHLGNLVVFGMAEPGLLIPALSVRAAGEEVARFGRPWMLIGGGVGWQF